MSRKTPIDLMLDRVDWQKLPEPDEPTDLPFAIYSGILTIGDTAFKVYVLNTGQRVFDADCIAQAFGGKIEPL